MSETYRNCQRPPMMNERQLVRARHSKLDGDRALAYALMAESRIFRPKYAAYVGLVKLLLRRTNKLKILNIGFAAGNVERMLVSQFGDALELLAVDNSDTFYRYVRKRNQNLLATRLVRFIKADILKCDLGSNSFDLILSRDLNHHIPTLMALDIYLKKCKEYLRKGGLLLMEDLRYDAGEEVICGFIKEIYRVEELKRSPTLLYIKTIGMLESFASAYKIGEVIASLKRARMPFKGFLSEQRYHFLCAKESSVLDRRSEVLKYLREGVDGKRIIENIGRDG